MDDAKLEELEWLAAQATPGPWVGRGNHIFCADNKRLAYVEAERALDLQTAAYIVAACNTVPELVAENRALQERVRELERQRDWLAERLAFICRSHNDCVLECPKAILKIDCPEVTFERWIEAAKEAGE